MLNCYYLTPGNSRLLSSYCMTGYGNEWDSPCQDRSGIDRMDQYFSFDASCHIDEDSFTGSLPNNKQSDYSRRQNCKHPRLCVQLERIEADFCLVQYIHECVQECLEKRNRSYKDFTEDDLQQMAADGSSPYVAKACCGLQWVMTTRANSSAKFLRMILLLMLDSSKLTELVATIQSLPEPTQQVVGALMQEMVDWEPDSSLDIDEVPRNDTHYRANLQRPFSPTPDPRTEVLHLEEQYAKIMSQLERRNMEYADLKADFQAVSDSLARSQETNDALSTQIIEKDDQLKKQRLMNSNQRQSSTRDLESKISQQEEAIAGHEAQLAKSHFQVAELQRENKILIASSEKLQKLQDEYDVMKLELGKQTRKANTADKYVQKLQASQIIEKERDFFRQELEGARGIISASENIQKENIALQKSNDEASRTLSQVEQENEELRMTRKQLRLNYDSLAQQVNALNERFAQDQETIVDLKDRYGGFQAPTSPFTVNGGLEGELTESSMHENRVQASQLLLRWTRILTLARKTRLADLEKQNQQLSFEAADKDAKLLTLQRQVEDAQGASAEHHTQLQKSRQECITLQTPLAKVQQGHPIEGSVYPHPESMYSTHGCQSTEVFKRMHDQVRAADARHAKLEDELSVLRKELECARDDRTSSSQNHYMLCNLNIDLLEGSLVHNDKLVNVEQVERQNAEELTEIRVKYHTARKQIDALRAELDGYKERRQLNHNTPNNLDNEELLDILNAASPGQPVESMSDAIINKIEDGRERIAVKQEVDHQISSSSAAYDTVSLFEKEVAKTERDHRHQSLLERILERFSRADKK
ncbi:MAG: hypothetical protein Q9217_006219 [Psora testacea]